MLTKRVKGGTEGEFLSRQKLVWVGQPGVLEREPDAVPLVLPPPDTVPREAVLRALREAGRRWAVRFEASTITGLRAAVLAGLGVAAFGVGMIPPDLTPLPADAPLPSLEEAEFILGVNPLSKDPVVATFAELLRQLAPTIIARLEEEQAGLVA